MGIIQEIIYQKCKGWTICNHDKYDEVSAYWFSVYVKNKRVTYFHSFCVEHILKDIENFVGNQNTIPGGQKKMCLKFVCV